MSIRKGNITIGGNGADGFSPTATVTKVGSTATISITDKNGTTTATVNDGGQPTTVKDLVSTSITLQAQADTNYIYGELSALNLTFGTGTDNNEIDIMFKSGATATTLTISGDNKIHGSFTPNVNSVVEINAKYYSGINKWVVLFSQVTIS